MASKAIPTKQTSASKGLGSLAPRAKQKPGGDAGPGGKINSAAIRKAPASNLMAGSSAYRGSGGHK